MTLTLRERTDRSPRGFGADLVEALTHLYLTALLGAAGCELPDGDESE